MAVVVAAGLLSWLVLGIIFVGVVVGCSDFFYGARWKACVLFSTIDRETHQVPTSREEYVAFHLPTVSGNVRRIYFHWSIHPIRQRGDSKKVPLHLSRLLVVHKYLLDDVRTSDLC